MSSILARVQRFRWQQWLLVVALIAALAFAALQVASMVGHARALYPLRNDPIAPWMTVAHVAHAFHVPDAVIEEAIGMPAGSSDRRPLGYIARQRGETFEVIRARIEAAIAGATPPAPPAPPAPPPAPARR
ncbi:MAG: hypothetical protein WC211_04355 [Dehalococcoidia bacterium]